MAGPYRIKPVGGRTLEGNPKGWEVVRFKKGDRFARKNREVAGTFINTEQGTSAAHELCEQLNAKNTATG